MNWNLGWMAGLLLVGAASLGNAADNPTQYSYLSDG